MSTKAVISRSAQQAIDQDLAEGLTKHAQTLGSFTIAGTPVGDIIAILQTRTTSAKTVESTRATWRAAVQADRDERAKSKALVLGVRQSLQIMFAGSIETLADYGLTPRKPRVVSPGKKVAAAAKAKATRRARHTMSKKQKAGIKADVTGVVVTPVTAIPAQK